MLIASDNPALYDLYNSPSRSPFSNILGQGIRGMPAAPGSLQGPMQSLSQLQGQQQLSGLGIGGMNQASPFASSIRPDIRAMQQAQAELGRSRSPVNQQLGRMAAPGTNMATGAPFSRPPPRPMGPPITGGPRPSRPYQKPDIDPFAGTPLEGTGGIKPANDLPISVLPDVISDDTGFFGPHPPAPLPPKTGGPTPPPISQPPRPFGGNQFGGIGGFFNQLAMMSPEQYDMGMNRYQQFSNQFGPSMGGGYGMFNQLAQLTPEQYDMGMNRFQQFNQQFGQMPPRFNQMPPPMTGGPRPMGPPMMPQPISRPFGGGFGPRFNNMGGGFGGQRFQPQMMPRPQFNQFGGGFGGFNQAPNPFGGSFNSPLRQFMGPQILPFNMQPMTGITPTPGQPQTSIPMPPPPQPGQPQTSIGMPPPPGVSAPTVQPPSPNQPLLQQAQQQQVQQQQVQQAPAPAATF